MSTRRHLAIGGLVGPAAFIGAWAVGAFVTAMDYSSVDDAISRLAAVGADTRWLMTSGFVVFGCALAAFAMELRRRLAGAAWVAALGTGIATLGVAATPLDRSDAVDTLHGAAASIGYVTLAATPALACRPLLAAGQVRLAVTGAIAAVMSALALAMTSSDLPTGLVQRLGLTVSDVWIVALAVVLLRDRPGAAASGDPVG